MDKDCLNTVWIVELVSYADVFPDTFLLAIFLEKPTKINLENLLGRDLGSVARKTLLEVGDTQDLVGHHESYFILREVNVGDKGVEQ